MSNDGKLYVRANCSVCRGREGIFCVYCDEQGLHFIEASEKTIARWIFNLTKESKKDMLKYLQKEQLND